MTVKNNPASVGNRFDSAGLSLVDEPTELGWYRYGFGAERAKRTLDVTVSIVLLIVLSPVFLAIALAVRLTSPGPALFRQTRVGFAEQPFTILKFRTMAADNDPAIHRELVTSMLNGSIGPSEEGIDGTGKYKLADDPRITGVGRFLRRTSMDELPQLINVLRGEMSLVGPRPSLHYEVGEYTPRQRLRAMSVPGMTGLWQVEGRSDLHMHEALELDLTYVETCSLGEDLKLLARTATVLTGRTAA